MNRRINDIIIAQYKRVDHSNNTDGMLEANDGVKCHLLSTVITGEGYTTASPTADAPVTVYQFGAGALTVSGKNLTPQETLTVSGDSAYCEKLLGDVMTMSQGTYAFRCMYEQKKTKKTLGIVIRSRVTGDILRNATLGSSASGMSTVINFDVPRGECGVRISLCSNYTSDVVETECEFSNIMIVKGYCDASTMPAYEAVRNRQVISSPALYAAGWNSRDKWDVTRGNVRRAVQKLIADGENVKFTEADTSGDIPIFKLGAGLKQCASYYKDIFCTHFTVGDGLTAGSIRLKEYYPWVCLWDTSTETLEEANAWLAAQAEAGAPVTIYTGLKKPYDERVTAFYPIEPEGSFVVMPCGGTRARIEIRYITHVR